MTKNHAKSVSPPPRPSVEPLVALQERQEPPVRLKTLGEAPVCARCAARGPTCCEPEDGLALAALTPGDVRRISLSAGLSAEKYSEVRRLDDVERAALESDDPVLRGLVGDDGALRSLSKRGRACIFHEAGRGCSLAFEARPLLCRRFPIVRDRARLSVRPGGDCLAIEEARDMPELLAALDLTTEDLARIDRRIRSDLRR